MSRKALFVALAGLASIASVAVAQTPPDAGGGNQGNNGGPGGGPGGRGGPGGQGGQGGGRGNFDPAAMQQRMMDRLKEQMKAPDDEWNVIQPKLEKVMTAQREARAGGGGFGRGGPGGGGPGGGGGGGRGGQGPADNSELGKASAELRTAVEAENASPDQIKAKLQAFRDARTKAEANLKSAREELKGVLNEREEAVLVMYGMLE